MTRKYRKVYERMINDLGAEVIDIRVTSGVHLKFICRYRGEQRFFIAAWTPSDRRASLNFKSDVRRWVQEVDKHV